jgi:tetratricopeptide (TPR) repeat protein
MACGLLAGRRALDEGQPSLAESWFRKAIAAGGDDAGTRAAYIGLGDVLFAQGDYVGAAEAYLRALEGLSPGDSLHTVASERLNAIANAGRIIP